MKPFLTIVMLLLMSGALLSSCGSSRHLPVLSGISDSTVVRYSDSTVIRYDTVTVHLPSESFGAVAEPSDTSHLQTSLAESSAWVDASGLLHHTLTNRSDAGEIPILVPIKEHFVSTEGSNSILRRETIEVPRELTRWQRMWMTLGKVAAGALAALLAAVAVKLLIKFGIIEI